MRTEPHCHTHGQKHALFGSLVGTCIKKKNKARNELVAKQRIGLQSQLRHICDVIQN